MSESGQIGKILHLSLHNSVDIISRLIGQLLLIYRCIQRFFSY